MLGRKTYHAMIEWRGGGPAENVRLAATVACDQFPHCTTLPHAWVVEKYRGNPLMLSTSMVHANCDPITKLQNVVVDLQAGLDPY